MQSIRVALIGAGGIARDQHLPAWSRVPYAKVVAVADPSAEALSQTTSQFGVARAEQDYRRLLDDPSIDVVDVCVPSALHADVASAALQAGKHVLCEKPMATSRAGAERMLTTWRGGKTKLMIGQNMRFDLSVERLRSHLEHSPPGHVYYTRAQWLRRRRLPARSGFTDKHLSGGGALYDLGVHILDLAWWLTGCATPATVSGGVFHHLARRTDVRGEWGHWDHGKFDVEDFAAGLVRFVDGSLLSLEASWLALQPEREYWRLQIFGTEAGVIWPDGTVSGEVGGIPWDLKLGKTPTEPSHHEVIRRFAQAVRDDTPVPIPPEQSATTIAILDALYASAASGREAPVLPFSVPA